MAAADGTRGSGGGDPPGADRGGALDEKLPLRDGDLGLSYSRVRALPLFDDLPMRVEGRLQGKGGQGAVVLRRFRAGEVICRQEDPGWTAFYLIRNVDLIAMRVRHRAKADAADELLASRAPELLALPLPDRKRRAGELDREGRDAELAELLFASVGRPDPGEIEALVAEQELLDAGDEADARLEQHHPSLLELDIAGKLQHAGELASSDEPLAALLRASARAAERRLRVEVTARPPAAALAPGGAWARLRALLGGAGAAGGRGVVEGDGGSTLDDGAPSGPLLARLSEGELFGELACLHHAPRAATVSALRDCYVVELLGHVLRLLLENKAFREEMDRRFRQRGLAPMLRALPLLAAAPDEAIELLRRRAALDSRAPGTRLFDEGEAADSLYVVRTGTVRVMERSADATERVVGFRSRGELLGESDFLGAGRRSCSAVTYEHARGPAAPPRRATVDRRVELVRIDRALWDELCALAPSVRQAGERLSRTLAATATAGVGGASGVAALGLLQGRRLMLIDQSRCTGCDDCVRACAEVQPDRRPRLALVGPAFDGQLVPATCRDCVDPACLVGCPVGAIHQGAAGQIVIERWCIGCGLCAAQCPYGAIEVRPVTALDGGAEGEGDRAMAAVCDQCAGVRGGPRCVSACGHGAAVRVDARAVFGDGAVHEVA